MAANSPTGLGVVESKELRLLLLHLVFIAMAFPAALQASLLEVPSPSTALRGHSQPKRVMGKLRHGEMLYAVAIIALQACLLGVPIPFIARLRRLQLRRVVAKL